jgi:tRNA U34 5-carboxymethylaminomethyl modifying GTPase MnmE/TrmE
MHMTDTRNILIIGRTGSGKSALANILINKEENFEKEGNFEEVFKESGSSISKTRDIQTKKIEVNGTSYRIVDTIGICSSFDLTDEEIAREITKVCNNFKDGLSQVLFVIGGKFSREEIKFYNIVRKKLFDEDITKFTTIVRTKFPNFRNPEQCEKDKKSLKEENKRSNKKIKKMANSCNNIIYIDNPSLSSANQ